MLPFFWRYVSLIWYFRFTLKCLWSIMWRNFWDFCNFVSNFIINQITSCFFSFLNCSFRRSFRCNCDWLFSLIKKFLALFIASGFSYIFPFFYLGLLAHLVSWFTCNVRWLSMSVWVHRFPVSNNCNKNFESNKRLNKRKWTSHHQSVK